MPSLVVAIIPFAALGSPGDFDASPLLSGIERKVAISPWSFIPLLTVLCLSLARFPPFVTIFFGAVAGAALAIVQDPSRVIAFASAPELPTALALLKGAWAALATGYSASTGDPSIDAILSRGGMSTMMVTVWLIISALSFGAVIEHAGLLKRLIDPLIERVRSIVGLISTLVATCFGMNVMTSDQYIAIALPGRLFGPAFSKRGLAPAMLSRVVGDSATVTSPLVPWNSCGAYMAATIGVPTTMYAAYCFFNVMNPLVTILLTLFGIRVLRIEPKAIFDRANRIGDSDSPVQAEDRSV